MIAVSLHPLLFALLLLAGFQRSLCARQCSDCPADLKALLAESAAGGRSHEQLAYDSFNAGVACSTLGFPCCAASHWLVAIDLKPTLAQAYQNIANVIDFGCEESRFGGFRIERSAPRALEYHRLSVVHAPNLEFKAGAMSNMFGLEIKMEAGKTKKKIQNMVDEMMAVLAQLPQPWPEIPHYTLATLHSALDQRAQAHQVLLAVLANFPNNALALLNVGNYHFLREEYGKAVRYYTSAVGNMTEANEVLNKVMAMCNVGQCYREQEQVGHAERTFKDALRLLRASAPSPAELVEQEQEQEQGLKHRAYHRGTEVFTAMNLFAMKSMACSWENYEHLEWFLHKSVVEQIQSPDSYVTDCFGGNGLVDPYTLTLLRYGSRDADMGNSRLVCSTITSQLPLTKQLRTQWGAAGSPERTLRVGYLSQDWRNHPMGRLTMKLVTTPHSGKVNSSCISYGVRDYSAVRKYVTRHAREYHDILNMNSNFDAAEFVAKLELDVLVDLTAHTYRGRVAIAAAKPAPIVINYLGYPGSTGCSGFDYSMVDAVSAPPELAPSAFSEKLIYLPHVYQSNHMEAKVLPCLLSDRRECRSRTLLSRQRHSVGSSRPPASADKGKGAGLGVLAADSVNWAHEGRTWLCSLNTNKKLEPLVFQAWMQLLQEVPRALLVLIDMDDVPKAAMLANAAYHGVHASRLVFIKNLPWLDHLYRLSACDLVLDTFTYGAHTTASDALWMWVPVLAMEGSGSQRMPSRVAAAITRSLLHEIAVVPIVQSIKQYQTVGSRLSHAPRVAHSLHDQIAKAALREPTFAHTTQQTSIERAYQAVTELRASVGAGASGMQRESSSGSSGGGTVMHVIVGGGSAEQRETESYLLKNQLVADLNACLKTTGTCPMQTMGALAGRLLASYPLSTSARKLQELVLANGLDRQEYDRRKAECAVLAASFFSANGELSIVEKSEHASLLLQPCVLIDPMTVLDHWLRFQVNAQGAEGCAQELIMFTDMSDFFFQNRQNWIEQGVEQLPVEFTTWLQGLLPTTFKGSGYHISSHIRALITQNSPAAVKLLRQRLAQILNNHAVCLAPASLGPDPTPHKLRLARSGIMAMAAAYDIDVDPKRLMNLGLLMQFESNNAGHLVAARAAVQMHDERREEYLLIPRPALTKWAGPGASVAIYCYEYDNAYWGRWGPSSLEEGGGGLGGSEEAVVYMAEELARRGHRVTVYADPPDNDLRRGLIRGVRWRRHTDYHAAADWDGAPDLFISWRYGLSLSIGTNARKRLLWLQDLIEPDCLPPPAVPGTSLLPRSIMVLGEFHHADIVTKLRLLGYSPEEALQVPVIVPNGIDARYLEDMQGINPANVFVYGSSPVRGLEQVLHVWPQIRAAVPDAELRVYYGFPQHVNEQLEKAMGVEQYRLWRQGMEQLLRQEGVTYVGAVGHAELARAYAAAGFLLYPTRYPETGCITVQKAMASGAIPITSKYTTSVLPFLAKNWDLGPQQALQPGDDYWTWLNAHWVPAVIAAAKAPLNKLQRHREMMKSEIQRQYSWVNAADTLVRLMPEEDGEL